MPLPCPRFQEIVHFARDCRIFAPGRMRVPRIGSQPGTRSATSMLGILMTVEAWHRSIFTGKNNGCPKVPNKVKVKHVLWEFR